MKNDKIMLKISNAQFDKLEKLVDYFKSDKAKVIRRGIYLIYFFKLDIEEFEDDGNKSNHFTVRVLEEELKMLNELSLKYNLNKQDILRYSIEIQYNILEDLKEYEKKLLTGK